MKKRYFITALLVVLCLACFMAGCGEDGGGGKGTAKSYTITFLNYNDAQLQSGLVKEGVVPTYQGAVPVRQSTAEFEYTFDGWTSEIVAVTQDATYTAKFTESRRSYTITFKNYDGTVLQSPVLEYGATPEYTGTPARVSTAKNDYVFTGWKPAITSVVGAVIYTAQFKAVAIGYQSGIGTEQDPYVIASMQQMTLLVEEVNFGVSYIDEYFVLDTDIDCDGEEWTPIGGESKYFAGTFDGNNHKITNFKITQSVFAGIFGQTCGVVKNLGVENFSISATNVVAGIAGGIAGYNNGGAIVNCFAVGDISFNASYSVCAGGLVGKSTNGTITNCFAVCDVEAKSAYVYSESYAGGLVGQDENGTITNCFATGDIDIYAPAGAYGGGLVGCSSKGVISGCFATGNITSETAFDDILARAGGLIGEITEGSVVKSHRYAAQTFDRKEGDFSFTTASNGLALSCTLTQLNSVSFYTDTLEWSENIWDFTDLDFEGGIYPVLKI